MKKLKTNTDNFSQLLNLDKNFKWQDFMEAEIEESQDNISIDREEDF